MTKTQELAKAHRISIEFIGTDSENEAEYQPLYAIGCSCNGLPSNEAFSGPNANRRIARHLSSVGLTESFTQR